MGLEMNSGCAPFLKWAGGKRWLTTAYPELFPLEYERYFEPFLGGGAVFFKMAPARSVISDANSDLIDCYIAIRDDWGSVNKILSLHQNSHCEEYYYLVRASEYPTAAERAAKFLYLNRTCWNGLYRVNLKGKFNVPIGTKNQVLMGDNFESISNLLRKAHISCSDFEETIDAAMAGDFIFVDPPYTVRHNLNGFVKYNEKIFSWNDQVRLKNSLLRASQRGCYIMATNAYHNSVIELYSENFKLRCLDRKSTIGGFGAARGRYAELLLTNY